jgi:response regulator RpfG family c-di-GMP phosphodiesterase
MTYKLLIVDDEVANLRLLERLFRQDYFCLTAPSGEEALRLLDQHDVAVIISDQRMPQMTGLELLKRSSDRRPHMVRILLTGYTDLEALVEAVNCGLVYMYISKPWNNEDLKLRVSRAVEHYENNKLEHALMANNERLTARIKEMRSDLVTALGRILQLQDHFLHSHAARVSKYAARVGERMGLSEELLSDMMAASFLHDLGTFGTAGNVYSSVSRDENVSLMKNHAARAVEVVACVAELRDTADIIRYHYENFDGSGGPLGLIGEQIPLTARILRVAKSFDLLTGPRYEEQALSPESAMERIRRGSGKEYDPVVVQTFSNLITGLTEPIPVTWCELQQLGT